jgi:hypothetical protein
MTQLSKKSRSRLAEGILSTEKVAGLTHNFYRYPARFSPDFVRAIIREFTNAGDLKTQSRMQSSNLGVVDPHMETLTVVLQDKTSNQFDSSVATFKSG